MLMAWSRASSRHTRTSTGLLDLDYSCLAMGKMGMEKLNDKPYVPGLAENIARMHVTNREDVFNQIVGEIVNDVYEPFQPPGPPEPIQLRFHVPGQGNVAFQWKYYWKN